MDAAFENRYISKIDELVALVVALNQTAKHSLDIDMSPIELAFAQLFSELSGKKLTQNLLSKLGEFQKHFEDLGQTVLKQRDVLSLEMRSLSSHEKGIKAYTSNALLKEKA
jgi:hypothetical protein